MAGNIELITGHGESNHISSFDMRASNRSIFGKGKYILNDAENMAVEIDASAKSIKIKSGSCVWSGMHIRIETSDTISFVSPATSDTVYVWLHYTRNASDLVEDVEFVSTTTSRVDSSLIYDEVPDDVTEAYALFYSFVFNPEGNVISNSKSDFVSILGMNDFFDNTIQKLNAQAAQNANQLKELSDDVNNTILNFEHQILDVVYDSTLLTNSTLSGNALSKSLTLSESAENFKALLIVIDNTVHPLWLYSFGSKYSYETSYMEETTDSQITINKVYFSLSTPTVVIFNSRKYIISKGTLGGLNTDYSYNFSGTIKIYGIGRVANESV